MINGTYWEFFCYLCGYFPQMQVTKENEKQVKEIMLQKIREHSKKHQGDGQFQAILGKILKGENK